MIAVLTDMRRKWTQLRFVATDSQQLFGTIDQYCAELKGITDSGDCSDETLTKLEVGVQFLGAYDHFSCSD